MKNLFLVALTTFMLVSCSTDYDINKTVSSPKSYTTVEKQSMVKDTLIVSIDYENGRVYVFNEKNIIMSKLKIVDNSQVVVKTWYMAISSFLMVFFFVILMNIWFDS